MSKTSSKFQPKYKISKMYKIKDSSELERILKIQANSTLATTANDTGRIQKENFNSTSNYLNFLSPKVLQRRNAVVEDEIRAALAKINEGKIKYINPKIVNCCSLEKKIRS